jgi:hypothetical protein
MPRITAREIVDKSLPAGVNLLPRGKSLAKYAARPQTVEARPSSTTSSDHRVLTIWNIFLFNTGLLFQWCFVVIHFGLELLSRGSLLKYEILAFRKMTHNVSGQQLVFAFGIFY